MISAEVNRLEKENYTLREALKELQKKMEQNQVLKPKSCQYCKNYVQHYMRNRSGAYRSEYTPLHTGHCASGVPVCKGRKKNPSPEDTCPYFEMGTIEMKFNVRGEAQ